MASRSSCSSSAPSSRNIARKATRPLAAPGARCSCPTIRKCARLSRPVRWSEVTAIFGGTFDPPHRGHRIALEGLFENPGVRAVRVLPSPTPPHKPAMAPAEARAELARLALVEGAPSTRRPVTLDLRELNRAAAHPGQPTYTFDTLQEIRRELPEIAFVIGTDQLDKIHTWHRFPEFLGLSHWIVLERKQEASKPAPIGRQVLAQLEASGLLTAEGAGYRVRMGGTFIQVFETPAPALSSTRIRESIAKTGQPPEGAIPPDAHAYLMKQRLYGTSPATLSGQAPGSN